MEADFWHRRWHKNEIGFHENEGNHLLKRYFDDWQLPKNARVFVPLCGKTKDIAWLLLQGVSIVAIELNESAVQALFADLGIEPTIESHGALRKYSVENLVVYVGDFFALTSEDIADVDGIFDRGALVAWPEQLRDRYSEHLSKIAKTSKQFIVTYEYDQTLFAGPPFSVTSEILHKVYACAYEIRPVYSGEIEGGFRGHDAVHESVYMLTPANK